ncbi:MAG: extracellular solute-binding protein, partial [Anaerolineaceae bacterium]|nr:extracellular solute-binding protein [Anaerolineaceae bacterium]
MENRSRMISRRFFLKAAGLGLAAGTLAACAPGVQQTAVEEASQEQSDSGKLEGLLTIMGPATEILDQDLDGFKEKYPGMQTERIDPDPARLKDQLAAGTPPDIIRTDGADLQSLLLRNVALDLTGYFATSSLLKEDDFAPSCEYYHVKGKWYGLPKDWSPDFSFYMNTTLASAGEVSLPPFDKSITYADLFNLARMLTKKEGENILVAGYGYEQSFFARQLMAILLEEDQTLYSEDFSKVIIRDNEIVMDVLKGFADLSKEGSTWSPLNPCPTWPGQEFINGTEAIAGYGYWYHAMLNTPAEDAKVDGKSAAFFPAPTWTGKKTVNPTIGGSGYIGARDSKNPAASWAFLEWYLGDRPAQERAASGWGVPALKSLYVKMPQANDFQKQVRQVLQYTFDHGDASYALKFNPYYADQVFNSSFTKNLEGVLKSGLT